MPLVATVSGDAHVPGAPAPLFISGRATVSARGAGDDQPRKQRRLRHDSAGEPYPTAMSPVAGVPSALGSSEVVASRSTDAEAKDLLALRRAKRGDSGAFADLIRSNDQAVRSLIWALCGPGNLDDLASQTYLRAFRGLPLAPSTSPRIWLLGIADGLARDQLRRVRQQGGSSEVEQPPIPLDMPDDERLALAAIDVAGLTEREAARLVAGGIERTRDLVGNGRALLSKPLIASDVPEHRLGFWNVLGRRLLVEASAPAATHRTTFAAPQAGTTKTAAPPTRRTVAVARGMAKRVEQQQPRTFPWRQIATGLAIVCTVAVLAGLALSVAGKAANRDAGLGDTTVKMLNRLDGSLARNSVVRGTVSIWVPPALAGTSPVASGTSRFMRSNIGSWRITATDGSIDDGYDVATATATTIKRPAGDPAAATVRREVAPGPPEVTGATQASLGDVLANVIRTVRDGSSGYVRSSTEPIPTTTTTTSPSTTTPSATSLSDGSTTSSTSVAGSSIPSASATPASTASPTTRRANGATTAPPTTEGRPVWVVTSRLDASESPAVLAGTGLLGKVRADEAELVADQALGLPSKLTLRRAGRTVLIIRFSALSLSQQPASSSYAPEVLPGVAVTTVSKGFVPTKAGELAGVNVPTPSYLPGGYVLASTAVNRATQTIVVCYRNGSRQLVVTRRPRAGSPVISSDPIGQVADEKPAKVTISSGSLAGSKGFSRIGPVPHVWVEGSTYQVIAVGDPPVDQLTKVLASLR